MEGHIYIYGEITSYQGADANYYGAVNPRDVQDQIQANKDASDLIVHINSPGGDVDAGFAIFDILKSSGKNITTRIEGQCYSIATVIALAGKKREATQNSEFLIHNPYSIAMGDADDMEKRAGEVRKMEDKIANHYASLTSISSETALEEMKKDTFMDLQAAKDYGFITDIIETVKAVAKFNSNIKKMAYKKEKGVLAQLAALLNSKESKNVIAKTADGKEVEFFERNEGQISKGDKATIDGDPPNGDIVMASGETYTFLNGVLDVITPKKNDDAEKLDFAALVKQEVANELQGMRENFQTELYARDQKIEALENDLEEKNGIFEGLKGIVADNTVNNKGNDAKPSDKKKEEKKSVFFPEGINNLN